MSLIEAESASERPSLATGRISSPNTAEVADVTTFHGHHSMLQVVSWQAMVEISQTLATMLFGKSSIRFAHLDRTEMGEHVRCSDISLATRYLQFEDSKPDP